MATITKMDPRYYTLLFHRCVLYLCASLVLTGCTIATAIITSTGMVGAIQRTATQQAAPDAEIYAQELYGPSIWGLITLILAIPTLIVVIAAVITPLRLQFFVWRLIQGDTARTTPGKAVGFLFLPLFNLYWMFVAFCGLAVDLNMSAEKHGVVKRASVKLAWGYCLLVLLSVPLMLLADAVSQAKIAPGISRLSLTVAITIVYVLFLKSIATTATAIATVQQNEDRSE